VLGLMIEALIVIVHRDRQHFLGMTLADDIIIQDLANLLRCRDARRATSQVTTRTSRGRRPCKVRRIRRR
jgi:hypothetical protein